MQMGSMSKSSRVQQQQLSTHGAARSKQHDSKEQPQPIPPPFSEISDSDLNGLRTRVTDPPDKMCAWINAVTNTSYETARQAGSAPLTKA